jgi:hypothetical protein
MSPSFDADRSARALSHTRLRGLLADRAAILHRDEHAALLDAADALLFDEPDALSKRASGHQVLAALVDSDRWLPDPAAEVGVALDGCGAPEPVTRSARTRVDRARATSRARKRGISW